LLEPTNRQKVATWSSTTTLPSGANPHLLRQTSDWEGTLWGKPDWADRPPANQPLADYVKRARNEPGTSYKYNDVRVNVLAYAALQVWRRPLPQVLREYVMDPIGASNTWRWY